MKVTEINTNSGLTMLGRFQAIDETVVPRGDAESTWENAPQSILQSALAALSDGRISEAVEHFDEHFKFKDCALTLEFTEKARLTEYFQKSRALFPDATVEVVRVIESGDHAIAEWKLSATQTVAHGSMSYRFPVSLHGSTIARVKNGRIVEWSDYYDQISSRRTSLAAFFTEWVEY